MKSFCLFATLFLLSLQLQAQETVAVIVYDVVLDLPKSELKKHPADYWTQQSKTEAKRARNKLIAQLGASLQIQGTTVTIIPDPVVEAVLMDNNLSGMELDAMTPARLCELFGSTYVITCDITRGTARVMNSGVAFGTPANNTNSDSFFELVQETSLFRQDGTLVVEVTKSSSTEKGLSLKLKKVTLDDAYDNWAETTADRLKKKLEKL